MSARLRRFRAPLLVLALAATAALVASGCAYFKQGSLAVSQPGGIGAARIHFTLCSENPEAGEPCEVTESEAAASQYMLGVAVPPGSKPPATITAVPSPGGTPIVYSLNAEVAQKMDAELDDEEPPARVWPPSGLQAVGYLSAPVPEDLGKIVEWSVDAEFGLPLGADAGPFAGPFPVVIASGWREVSPAYPAGRPIDCAETVGSGMEIEVKAFCEIAEGKSTPIADLQIAEPPPAVAFLGATQTFSFPFAFAGTVAVPPTFALSATTTLPGSKVTLPVPAYTPAGIDPATHRAAAAAPQVQVKVPSNSKPGLYEVTLQATTASGGVVSRVAKLRVNKAQLSIAGKSQLNEAKGTAQLSVKLPSAGALVLSGKGLAKVKRTIKAARTLKVTVKPKGKAKKALLATGTAKVSPTLKFTPTGAAAVKLVKKLTLKLK